MFTAWLNFLKRLRESDRARRAANEETPDAWRVPYGKDEYNADMKNWTGK